ncbi:S1C family serine protease [Rhizobacter sp. Root404]|uniref:S1C family serine protease n=1 Tax=Rhizobacter sp. Root404 TaxID=1736528 RepID=UPI0006F9635D|nr:serine protease [Rhizobacter sp. Root404]KQW35259.1 trypsin [Rhizobacter sp. Root404]
MKSLSVWSILALLCTFGFGTGAAAQQAAAPSAAASAPISLSARKVYEQARSQLVQIRTVLKGRASQTSVGSGFLVSGEGHIVTNFHVVAEAALKPEHHDLVYVTADGREAPLAILQLDVLHDLALLKTADPGKPAAPFDALAFRPDAQPLSQGERIYSLGNPLDVGFAVTEGTYNGLVRRSFYPQIFFGGALSGGMSGGPALDEQGRVIGINVARRVDGEQVSFLVPASFAAALLARGREAVPIKTAAYGLVTDQLMQHQALLTERFIAQGWKPMTHPRYKVPVPIDQFMRCWGSSEPSRTGGLDLERSDCVMDTRIFVGDYTTGAIGVRHESYDGSKLGTLRFAARYAASFRNESFTRLRAEHQTKPQCHEDYLDRGGLPLRAVVCLRAYKKLPGLYDLAVLVATLDQAQAGVQGRFDAQGLSFANAQRLAKYYLEAYQWVK